MSHSHKVALAIKHLQEGNHVLGYGHAEKPEPTFYNPKLYPCLFPWLFPYRTGGISNELMLHNVHPRTQIKHYPNYHDRRFQVDEYFPYIAFNQYQIKSSSQGAFVLIEKRKMGYVAEEILDLDIDVLTALIDRGK